jgi:molybdopterin synthase catalytic subunit
VAVGPESLPVDVATAWASVPSAGAVVVFLGIVRDHAEGRTDVTALTYEAYDTEATRVMQEIVATARTNWPELARVALLHRTGRLELSEVSVAVVVSSPHRVDAFDAARHCIDTLKETVPIWKQEHWRDGEDWGTGARAVRAVRAPRERT